MRAPVCHGTLQDGNFERLAQESSRQVARRRPQDTDPHAHLDCPNHAITLELAGGLLSEFSLLRPI